jgi:hypothetical protein
MKETEVSVEAGRNGGKARKASRKIHGRREDTIPHLRTLFGRVKFVLVTIGWRGWLEVGKKGQRSCAERVLRMAATFPTRQKN